MDSKSDCARFKSVGVRHLLLLLGKSMKYKRLSYDLYLHPLYGARTLEDIERMETLAKQPKPPIVKHSEVHCSNELSMRNEQCIDDNGVGLF